MTKELLAVEFRYMDATGTDYDYKTKTVTIGIYDTLEEAITAGNETLKTLSKTFEVRSDDKFMLKFLFGNPKRLVTNTCYPTKGIQYFATITKLDYLDINLAVSETLLASDRYKQYKKAND